MSNLDYPFQFDSRGRTAETTRDDHIRDIVFGRTGPRGGRQSQGALEAMAKSAARSIGSGIGRSILRGVLGSILGGKLR